MAIPAPITTASTKTPVTGATTYCTPAQLFTCFDYRTIADWLSDTDLPIGWVAATGLVDKTMVANNADLALLLQAASGKLEAAIQVGERYTPGDLILLTGGDPARPEMKNANAAMFIAQVVAGLCIASIFKRRPERAAPKLEMVEESKEILAALADGQAILPLQETMDAGHMQNQIEQLADVEQRNMPTWEARRLFGMRSKWRDT